MKSVSLKYVLIYCFAIALLFKTSGVASVFINSVKIAEYNSANQDTEKEEKKIETEYFEARMLNFPDLNLPVTLKEKILLRPNSFFPTYFPEVLTPPPSLEA